MPTTAQTTYSVQGTRPLHNLPGARARILPVRLAASISPAAGTIMGELTSTPGTYGIYDPTLVTAPAVQAAGTESDTGGTLVTGTYHVAYTFLNANGETTSSPVSAAITVGSSVTTGSITTTAVTPPAGCTVNWYANAGAGAYHLVGNTDGSSFTVTAVGSGAAPPGSNTAIAKTDGTQFPKGILAHPALTDGSGIITGLGDYGWQRQTAALWIGGAFSCADLNINGSAGISAAVVTALGGVLLEGTVSAGLFAF
jgi:hypothetical protein